VSRRHRSHEACGEEAPVAITLIVNSLHRAVLIRVAEPPEQAGAGKAGGMGEMGGMM
jgi:hypothetical protein